MQDAVFRSCFFVAVVLVLCAAPLKAVDEPTEPIAPGKNAALRKELADGAQGASSVEVRRACKSVIRKAEGVLEADPAAKNRFSLLEVLFQAQQRLLTLEPTEENRRLLFDTCERLAKAPDEYAESRLEADLLISERDLAKAEAHVPERVKALEEIIAKYRGTKAELRSLTIAALIAAKLQAFDFQKKLQDKLSSCSFGGDHKAIAFRRRSYSVSRLAVVFSGIYERANGSSITFPFDLAGHQYLVVFWSLKSQGQEEHEEFLSRVREQQERFPDGFEVYSFNLDDLPDAGQSILKRVGVKATALHLPGGRSSSAYNAYALIDPMAMFVNAQGHVMLHRGQIVPWPLPSPARGNVPANPGPGIGKWLDDERYLAQLRSLFIGDFLVLDADAVEPVPPGDGSDSSVPLAVREDIQKCFTVAPLRYRLTQEQSLANYRKAEKLCASAIKKYARDPGLWAVRNRRIVALLGMYNLAVDSKYLDEAVSEAQTTLQMDLPSGKDVVARFCLAAAALRRGDSYPEKLLSEFVRLAGGNEASDFVLAAAAVLAIEANAKAQYQDYRQRFLALVDEDDPSLWQVLTFLRDRQHNYRLFYPNPGRWGYNRKQKYRAKHLISAVGLPAETNRVLKVDLKELDGGTLGMPEDTKGKMTGVIFAEPPADKSERDRFVQLVKDYTSQFAKRDVPVVVAFLSEDTDAVKSLVKEIGGSFRAAMLPGGLNNPVVRRLGILSADRVPNPFLLSPDGTIAWSISGLKYVIYSGASVEQVISVSIGLNIEKLRTDRAFEPLQKGDFKKALLLLGERLPPNMDTDAWTPDRLHGCALAHMGLNQWEAALSDIDAAISQRNKDSRYGKLISKGNIEMHFVRATILKKLGRGKEADDVMAIVQKNQAWLEVAPDPEYPPSYARNGVPVGVYDELLKSVRVKLGFVEGGK